MNHLKTLDLSLLDLARDFHHLMVENKAKYFTIPGHGEMMFWYITDVREDGTYPCHPQDYEGHIYDPYYVDQDTIVTIHFDIKESI